MASNPRQWTEKLDYLAGELKRRKVIQVAGVYLVAAWGASQGVAEIMPLFGAPDWAVKAFVVVAFGALPAVIALAWMFDITPSGIKRDEPTAARGTRRLANDADDTTMMSGQRNGCVIVSWRDTSGDRQEMFTGDFTMGRGENCELRFHDPLISRLHAKVTLQNGSWTMTDLGSKNGTLLNGQKIATIALPARCEVRLDESGPLLQLTVLPPGKRADQETVVRFADRT